MDDLRGCVNEVSMKCVSPGSELDDGQVFKSALDDGLMFKSALDDGLMFKYLVLLQRLF